MIPALDHNTASKLWRSASPFVPPRYFFRRERGRVTLKEKDQPEWQLVECLRAVGGATGGQVWRQTEMNGILSRLESVPPLPSWDVVRAPGAEEGTGAAAVAATVHQDGGNGGRRLERRVGLFFEIEFCEPTSLPVPALGHSCHFGLGLFIPAGLAPERS